MTADGYTIYSSLKGKIVVITGGANGIGEALVRGFSAQGSRVHFLDIDKKSGAALADATDSSFHSCDLRNIEALRSVIHGIETADGGIDILINNAGNDDRHDMFSVEPSYWRDRLALNLDHQFFATQAAAPLMKKRGKGVIVLTSSTSFIKGRPGMVGYTTAKAAITGLNRTLARELGPSGIRVNCIVPGAISTERQERLWRTPDAQREIFDLQALKIKLEPHDVASIALFVASDDARGCTGAEFLIDAGITI